MKTPTIRLAIVLCTLGVALPASAADIRAQLTPDLIYNHCQAAGVGSETEGTFMLPTGRVTGSVLCTASDLAMPAPVASPYGDDEDDDDHGGLREDDDDDREDDDSDD